MSPDPDPEAVTSPSPPSTDRAVQGWMSAVGFVALAAATALIGLNFPATAPGTTNASTANGGLVIPGMLLGLASTMALRAGRTTPIGAEVAAALALTSLTAGAVGASLAYLANPHAGDVALGIGALLGGLTGAPVLRRARTKLDASAPPDDDPGEEGGPRERAPRRPNETGGAGGVEPDEGISDAASWLKNVREEHGVEVNPELAQALVAARQALLRQTSKSKPRPKPDADAGFEV